MQIIVQYVQTNAWFGLEAVGIRLASFKWLSVLVMSVTWKCSLTFTSDPDNRKHSRFEGNMQTYTGRFGGVR
jgi:hypothetical protein